MGTVAGLEAIRVVTDRILHEYLGELSCVPCVCDTLYANGDLIPPGVRVRCRRHPSRTFMRGCKDGYFIASE